MMYRIDWKYSPVISSSTRGLCLGVISLLMGVLSFAQTGTEDVDGVVIPGSIDNTIGISVYNPLAQDTIHSIIIDTLKSGRWISNIRFQPDSLGPIPGQSTARFTLLFDIDPEAEEGAIDSFVVYARAGGALLDRPRQRIVVRMADIAKASVVAYPFKQNAPPTYNIEGGEAILQYCATDITDINEYDDVAVYFTPRRSLDLAEPEKFNYRIVNPNGEIVGKGSNVISSTTTGEVYDDEMMLNEDAPGRFVHKLYLGSKHIPENEQERAHPPGTYTVETIGLESVAGSGLFGQGQGFEQVGEWQKEGTFEVTDGYLHFVGFIMEPVNAGMPRTTSRWSGATSIDGLKISKPSGSVSFFINAWWQNTKRQENDIYTAGDKVYRAETFVGLVFPTRILPGKSQKDPDVPSGTIFDEKPVSRVEIEWKVTGDESSSFTPEVFCPGPFLGMPNRQFDDKGWRAKISMNQELFERDLTISKSRIPNRDGKSVFNVGPVNDYEPFGMPPKNLAWHIRESGTLWLFPIKFSFATDHSIDFYAFGVYKTKPGSYDGANLDAPHWASASAEDPEGAIVLADPDMDGQVEGEVEEQETIEITPTPDAEISETVSQDDPVTPNAEVSETISQDDPVTPHTSEVGEVLPGAILSVPESSDLVTIEDYTGIRISEAVERINAKGLKPVYTAGPNASKEAEVGIVADQKLDPGMQVEPGGTVELTVYGPVQLIVVPNLVGLDIHVARSKLESQGVTAKFEHAGAAPSDGLSFKVKDSDPIANTRVKMGTPVTVRIYGEYSPPIVSVPDVYNYVLSDAVMELESVGLKVKPVLYGSAPSQQLSKRVRAQNPIAYSEVRYGDEIELEVYGEYVVREVTVPNVYGLTMDEARNRLHNSGLQIYHVIIGEAPSTDKAYRIEKQYPTAGMTLVEGSTVNVEIWGEYIVPVTQTSGSNSNCVVPVHDLTGPYSKGEIIVTSENGKYVGRNYYNYSETARRKGYQYGMVLFEIGQQPDITKSLESSREGVTYTAAYPGRCLKEINGAAAYSDCFVRVGFGLPEYVFGRLKLNYGGSDRYHDTRLEKQVVIQEVPCYPENSRSTPPAEPIVSESDCLKPSWVRNQTPAPDETITLCYRNQDCSDWTKDGDKYWFRQEYIVIEGDILKRYDACGTLVGTMKKTGTRPWDGGFTVWVGSNLKEDGTLDDYWWIFGLEN